MFSCTVWLYILQNYISVNKYITLNLFPEKTRNYMPLTKNAAHGRRYIYAIICRVSTYTTKRPLSF